MKRLLLLSLLWLLGGVWAEVQVLPKGPWRVVYQWSREKKSDDWWDLAAPITKPVAVDSAIVKELTTILGDSQSVAGIYEDIMYGLDTTTTLQLVRRVLPAAWNTSPDSICLFMHCENPLFVPGRGERRIRFAATGATLRRNKKQDFLWLAPTDSIVVLTARKGRKVLFQHKFRAVPPPMPEVQYFLTDPRTCSDCKSFSLNLKVIPDATFASIMPDDARYRVAVRQISLRRRDTIVLTTGLIDAATNDGRSIDAEKWEKTFQPGDQLKMEVLAVDRQNYAGAVERIPVMSQQTVTFPKHWGEQYYPRIDD